MELTAVYCLVCEKNSNFSNWAYISSQAAKRYSGISRTALCVDASTFEALEKHPIVLEIDEIHVVDDLPNASLRLRSRFVKTQIRQLVSGDIIFLDSDTIPIGDLRDLSNDQSDIAAVPDVTPLSALSHWYPQACKDLKWSIPRDHYLNSGVVYMKGSEKVLEFGNRWHERWLQWRDFDKSGYAADQPSFNSSLIDSNVKVKILDPKYNTMVRRPSSISNDPRVFHYFSSYGKMPKSSLLQSLNTSYVKTGKIDWKKLDTSITYRTPWIAPAPIVYLELLANWLHRKVERKRRTKV